MEILLPSNEKFNLNQPKNKLIDSKMCVFEFTDKDDMDFYYKKITSFLSYRYPTVTLQIGKYTLDLPLNWKVMTVNDVDYVCQLVPVEDLLHYPHTTIIFNPYYYSIPRFVNITIKGINTNPVTHFVPKLPKHNILVMPLGNKEDWTIKIENIDTKEITSYPDCIMACDDMDTSKLDVDLSQILG